MKKVELKEINLENYKKFESASYKFAPRTVISGRNRQGKTTLMDAYFDALTGKMANGSSPNTVRRKIDGEEVTGAVARGLTLSIDGVETEIRKESKSATKYEVDGFAYNKATFEKYLSDNVADPETFLICSNATAFLNVLRKSTVEAREKLEKMTGFDVSAFVKDNQEYSEVYGLTKGHSVEEALKVINRNTKLIQSKIDDKDRDIKKANSENVEVSFSDADRNDLLNSLEELRTKEQQLNDSNKAYDELSYEITGLKKSRDNIFSAEKERLEEEKRKITSLLNSRRFSKKQEEENLRMCENLLATTEKPEIIRQKITVLQNKYKEEFASKWDNSNLELIEKEEFNLETAICPTCGQNLPEEQVEQLKKQYEAKKEERIAREERNRERFEMDKKLNLANITAEGNAEVAREKEVIAKREEFASQIEQTKKNIATLSAEIVQREKELETFPSEPDMYDNKEYIAVTEEIQKKQEQLENLTDNSDEKLNIANQIREIEQKLSKIDVEIELREKLEKKKQQNIEKLEKERQELVQDKADKQREVDLLKEFSIAKNKALAEKINPYFKHFQFKFLDYTKDGEPVEVCKMMVDGIDYVNGLNHSDQILCNIDLVQGLQEMNGLNLPIWVDDAESVNDDRIPDTGRQMILLKVSEGELEVKEC